MILNNIQLSSISSSSPSIFTLAQVNKEDSTSYASSVTLQNSRISDQVVPSTTGTFLSVGPVQSQNIIHSSFDNITVSESSETVSPPSLTDTCSFISSSITRSTDTFNGILFSGLTDKTQFSFTASNSSFTDSTKTTLQSYTASYGIDCTPSHPSYENNQTMQRVNCSDTTVKHSFTNCTWRRCKCAAKDNGGAISADYRGLSLSIDKCIFSDCYCGNGYSGSGGAIFANSSSSLSVINSSFEWTIPQYQSINGGAIYLSSVPSVTVYDNTFTKCYTGTEGGAIEMKDCSTKSKPAKIINNCRFLHCHCNTEELGGGGGALYSYYTQQYSNLITNCVFTNCSSFRGAAFSIYYPFEDPTLFQDYSVMYCSFNKNHVLYNGYGNDVMLQASGPYIPKDWEPLFFYCFSTSSSLRVGYTSNGNYYRTDVSWLPQMNSTNLQKSTQNAHENGDSESKESAFVSFENAQLNEVDHAN